MKRVDHKFRPGFLIPVMILESAGCLVGAWAVPVMEAKLLFFFNEQVRLVDVLRMLVNDGDYMVAGILLLFALVVPICKLALMLAYWAWLRLGLRLSAAALKPLDAIGRWAMLDIFVAAIVVAGMKLDKYPARMTTGTAVTLLVAAFVLSIVASWLLKRACRRGAEGGMQVASTATAAT